MVGSDISILVVDDAKVSNVMIDRILKRAGYTNIRHASSAKQALKSLQKRKAEILLADWMMPEMDGLELTRRIRQLDEAKKQYTYVMLITGHDSLAHLREAFKRGVDDFVSKNQIDKTLVPRFLAAERIIAQYNRTLRENQLLMEANTRMRKNALVDNVTGTGNRRHALRCLQRVIAHVQGRGGCACTIVVNIGNLKTLQSRYESKIVDQVLVSVGKRLRGLVRPLDHVARIKEDRFAVVCLMNDIDDCDANTFKRIFNGLNLKPFKTNAGFLQVEAAMNICGADARTGLPDPKSMLEYCESYIGQATGLKRASVHHWEIPPEQIKQAG
jgi:diguanylate cyclase (GGDEF)-like protein